MSDRLVTERELEGILRRLNALETRLEREKSEVPIVQIGTWTPDLSGTTTPGTFTYNVRAGTYTRNGNRILFEGSINAATRPVAATGFAIITGLPFTHTSTANSHSPVTLDTIDQVTIGGTTIQVTARIPPNQSYIELVEVIAAGSAIMPAGSWTATTFIRVSGHYPIA